MSTPTYRPDIDGLRAIAVLAVVFYHSGFGIVSGGYVGVDVFFVISGFLITTIIVRELVAGKFSIAGFYERRMRRILPAIVATVSVCLLIGFFLFEPKDFQNLARSSIANNLFLSNVYFYWQTGYFDPNAELKPLLHTWSLSLEEQYYVVTPLLLMMVAKFFKQRFLLFVVPIFAVSFAANVYGMDTNPSRVFYMLPTRAWELAMGSMLAIAVVPRLTNQLVLQSLAMLGLSLIFFSIVVFDDQTAFPGAYAALPVFGTAILIYTGRAGTTLINRALAVRPVVFIGLISYSLYLWHWPVIVFSAYLKGMELDQTEKMFLLLIIFTVSVLSWRFVETPFRKKKLLPTRKAIFAASMGATVVLIIVALTAVVSVLDKEWRHWRSCENVVERISDNQDLCVVGNDSGAPLFLIWGDSHARSLNSSVDASAQRMGRTGYVASSSACAPLRGIEPVHRPECYEFNETVFSYVIQRPEIDTVVLIARWTILIDGTRYKNEEGDTFELRDVLAEQGSKQNQENMLDTGLRRTIQSLLDAGKKVFVVGPVPEVGYNVPSVNHIAQITNRDVNAMIAPTVQEFEARNARVLSILSQIQTDYDITVLSPSSLLCDDTICRVALDDGTSLYRDDHHLSTFGSKYISTMFDEVFSDQK